MTKEHIVNEVAAQSGWPKTKIASALDLFLSEVSDALVRRERVEIRRFGTFDVTMRRARVARDLNSNAEIRLSDRIMPRFTPFAAFKERVLGLERPTSAHTAIPVVSTDERSRNTGNDVALISDVQPARPLLETLEQRVLAYPEDMEARLALIAVCMDRERYEQALAHCQAVLLMDPRHLGILNRIGHISEMNGASEQAFQAYERALNINPEHIESLLNRGKLRSQTARYNEAEQDFKRILELDPANAQACLQWGLLYTRRGLYQKAMQEFERACEYDPSSPEACFNLGKTYDHLERYDDAIRLFESLVVLQPDHPRVYWHLGVLYDKKKMSDKALSMYQQSNRLSTMKKGSDRP